MEQEWQTKPLNVLLLYSITECKPCWKAPLPKGTKTLVNIEHFTGTPAYMHYKGRPIKIHRKKTLAHRRNHLYKRPGRNTVAPRFSEIWGLYPPSLDFALASSQASMCLKEWFLGISWLFASGLTVEEELWMDSSEIPNPGPQDQATK